jgi:hypothetical protein
MILLHQFLQILQDFAQPELNQATLAVPRVVDGVEEAAAVNCPEVHTNAVHRKLIVLELNVKAKPKLLVSYRNPNQNQM